MKYCFKPFRFIYVDWLGRVRLCSWMSGPPLGDLKEQSIEEIWHSDHAYKIRESMVDGSFRHCRKDVCYLIMNDTLPDIAPATVKELTHEFPDHFNLAYDYQCNLSCPSCRKQKFIAQPDYLRSLEKVYKHLAPHLEGLASLSLNGNGDPFSSRHMMTLLENMRPRKGARIAFETNGLLFTPALWSRIDHLADCDLSMHISVDSLNPATYAILRRGGDLAVLLKNLKFITKLRKDGILNFIEAIMVVQDLNFMEIQTFATQLLDMGFDSISLMPLYNWGTYTEREFFFKNLLNPQHPQHENCKQILDNALENPKIWCWAGRTSRKIMNFAILDSSHYAISEISGDDVLQADADVHAVTAAMFNREYVFIVDGTKYLGMLQLSERLKLTSNYEFLNKRAGDLCGLANYKAVNGKKISDVFRTLDSLKNADGQAPRQFVYPVVVDGDLVGKVLV